jgi:hypothetical protein
LQVSEYIDNWFDQEKFPGKLIADGNSTEAVPNPDSIFYDLEDESLQIIPLMLLVYIFDESDRTIGLHCGHTV